jgi:hypothetical protein
MVEENLGSEEKVLRKKSIAWAGFEPATTGSSGKHTNHYTIEATSETHYRSANTPFVVLWSDAASSSGGKLYPLQVVWCQTSFQCPLMAYKHPYSCTCVRARV